MSPVPRYAFGDVELDTGRVQLLKGGARDHRRAEGVRGPAAARRARAARRRQGRDLRGRLEGHRRHRQRADADRRAAAPAPGRRRQGSALHRDGVDARVSAAAGGAANRERGAAGGAAMLESEARRQRGPADRLRGASAALAQRRRPTAADGARDRRGRCRASSRWPLPACGWPVRDARRRRSARWAISIWRSRRRCRRNS